jgi:hypothetical protein
MIPIGMSHEAPKTGGRYQRSHLELPLDAPAKPMRQMALHGHTLSSTSKSFGTYGQLKTPVAADRLEHLSHSIVVEDTTKFMELPKRFPYDFTSAVKFDALATKEFDLFRCVFSICAPIAVETTD